MAAVQQLCASAIWLDNGYLKDRGSTTGLLRRYLQSVTTDQVIILSKGHRQDRPPITLQSLRFDPRARPAHGEPLEIEIEFHVHAATSNIVFGIGLNNPNGVRLLSCDSDLVGPILYDFSSPGRYCVTVRIPSLPLSPEHYTVDLGCRTQAGVMIDEAKSIGLIDIAPGLRTPAHLHRPWATVCHPGEWGDPVPKTALQQAIPA